MGFLWGQCPRKYLGWTNPPTRSVGSSPPVVWHILCDQLQEIWSVPGTTWGCTERQNGPTKCWANLTCFSATSQKGQTSLTMNNVFGFWTNLWLGGTAFNLKPSKSCLQGGHSRTEDYQAQRRLYCLAQDICKGPWATYWLPLGDLHRLVANLSFPIHWELMISWNIGLPPKSSSVSRLGCSRSQEPSSELGVPPLIAISIGTMIPTRPGKHTKKRWNVTSPWISWG